MSALALRTASSREHFRSIDEASDSDRPGGPTHTVIRASQDRRPGGCGAREPVGSRVSQDLTVIVSRALPAVFAILADPTGLSAWVSDITDVSRDMSADRPAILEESFALRLGDRAAVGEIISHEPPWSVAYRLTTADSSHVLRISCTACEDGATQVHLHQANPAALAVDLLALNRTLLDLDLTTRRLPDVG